MSKHTHETVTTTPTIETAPAPVAQPAPPAGATSPPPVFLTPPPADAHSPSPPPGFERPKGTNYRGVLPRGAELAAAPAALKDLVRFASTYATTLGATAPPYAHLLDGLTVAAGWTSLRAESGAWDAYCATLEGMAWQAFRPLLDKLVTAFKLAADSNKALLSEFPGLATLLGAKAQIAQKGVSTKRLNKKAVAEGKEPTHGAVGKKRQRQAQKAALAKAEGAGAAAAPAPAGATGTAQGVGH